jgi:hypothetical protein
MNLDELADMPDWNDENFNYDDEGEEWKPGRTREACKKLYGQWQAVMFLLKGILSHYYEKFDSDDIEELILIDVAKNIHGDAHIVGLKIRSSEVGDRYVSRMENAAIVRALAKDIYVELGLFSQKEGMDDDHIMVVRQEIEKFRTLFIEWVNTFEKDDMTDEWGLFV